MAGGEYAFRHQSAIYTAAMWRLIALSFAVIACSSPSRDSPDAGPPGKALTADEATAACMRFASCVGPGTASSCFSYALPQWSTAQAQCLAAANNCDQARACFGMTSVQDFSCGNTTTSCDGTILEVCSGGARTQVECSQASPIHNYGDGPACIPVQTGGYACGVATVCTTNTPTCNGDVLFGCDQRGAEATIDCAKYDQVCSNGVCTAPGGGGTCQLGTPFRCQGNAIVQCPGGNEIHVDCARLVTGAMCLVGDSSMAPYCGHASECDPATFVEQCTTTTTMQFCAGGKLATADCTALGFSGCFRDHCIP